MVISSHCSGFKLQGARHPKHFCVQVGVATVRVSGISSF